MKNVMLRLKTSSLFRCALVLFILCSVFVAADTPEQVQQYRYALGLIQRHLYKEAIRVLNRVLSDPSPFTNRDGVLFWLAESYYRTDQFNRAAGHYERLLREFPGSSFKNRAAYGLGWTHVKDNNPKSAVEGYARVDESDKPLWIDSRLKMGFLLTTYDMDSELALSIYERLLKKQELTQSQRFEAHLQAGIGWFNKSLFDKALENLQPALEISPDEKKQSITFYIAESLFRSQRFSEAIDRYRQVIGFDKTAAVAHQAVYSMAWSHIKSGSPASAKPLFQQLADDPSSPLRKDSMKNLVDLLMNLRRYEEAVERMDKARRLLDGKDSIEMHYMQGLALSRLGEFTRSLDVFQEFIKSNPKSERVFEARYQRALVQIALGRYKEALDELDPLLRRDAPAMVREKAIYRTGECYYNLGNLRAAKEYFDLVIKDYPTGMTRLDALYQLGEIA